MAQKGCEAGEVATAVGWVSVEPPKGNGAGGARRFTAFGEEDDCQGQ